MRKESLTINAVLFGQPYLVLKILEFQTENIQPALHHRDTDTHRKVDPNPASVMVTHVIECCLRLITIHHLAVIAPILQQTPIGYTGPQHLQTNWLALHALRKQLKRKK